MRLKQGDRINIFDGFGREFEAVIKSFSTKTVLIELGKIIPTADKENPHHAGSSHPQSRENGYDCEKRR